MDVDRTPGNLPAILLLFESYPLPNVNGIRVLLPGIYFLLLTPSMIATIVVLIASERSGIRPGFPVP